MVGRIELSETKKSRIAIYELLDELNDLDNQVWKLAQSHPLRDKFKKIRSLINKL